MMYVIWAALAFAAIQVRLKIYNFWCLCSPSPTEIFTKLSHFLCIVLTRFTRQKNPQTSFCLHTWWFLNGLISIWAFLEFPTHCFFKDWLNSVLNKHLHRTTSPEVLTKVILHMGLCNVPFLKVLEQIEVCRPAKRLCLLAQSHPCWGRGVRCQKDYSLTYVLVHHKLFQEGKGCLQLILLPPGLPMWPGFH